MSKKNSKARRALERIYGKGCFMERAGIREVKGIKKNAHMMTYHHLRHESEGGKATVENGANLKAENHEFLHSLPRAEEEKVNNAIRRWKMNFLAMRNGQVVDSGTVTFPDLTKDEDCIIIPLEDTTIEQLEELKEEILKLKKENSEKQMEIDRLKKEQEKLAFKAEAYDDLIESNSLFPIGIIAKSFGYTAQWLNEYLRQNGIQFKRDGVWELYAKYAKKGYARACWYNYSVDSYGRPLQRAHLYWTAKGLVFIRELLIADGKLKH